MKRFSRTDLAVERECTASQSEYVLNGIRVCEKSEMRDTETVRFGTLHFSSLSQIDEQESRRVTYAAKSLLANIASSLVPHPRCVLVACLGNPRLTPDALGPCTAAALEVTRHVQILNETAFAQFGKGALCLVTPGVLGQTGVESAELVRGVADQIDADLVIAVDALAAGSLSHLGSVLQISDHGLRPGSGMGNRRTVIDRHSVGCPVVSLGIPTVIDSATLICDSLSRAGICGVGESMTEHLCMLGHYLVAPADIDVLVKRGGDLLARVIGACFGIDTDAHGYEA